MIFNKSFWVHMGGILVNGKKKQKKSIQNAFSTASVG